MLFKDISYLQLRWPSCSAEQNDLGNFGRRHYEVHFRKIILNLDLWFRRCLLKIFLIYSSGGHLVQQSKTNWAILQRALWGTFLENYFAFGPVWSDVFKDISHLELWWPSSSAVRNHLGNFGRGHYEEYFCEIILKFDQWFRKRCRLKCYLSIALAALLFARVKHHLSNFGRGP